MMKHYSDPPYESKTPVRFKLHIDHIDNEDGRIWAVDVSRGPYLTARMVTFTGSFSMRTMKQKEQPRAYLYGLGIVTQYSPNLISIQMD